MNTSTYLFNQLGQLPDISLTGKVSIPAPNKHFRRTSNEWILYAVTAGSMCIREGKRQYNLTGGDILFLSPQTCHFGLPVNDSVRYLYIHFQWENLKELTMTPQEYQTEKIGLQEQFSLQWNPENHPDSFLLPKHLHPDHTVFVEAEEEIEHLIRSAVLTAPHQKDINSCLFYLLLLKLSRSEICRLLPQTSSASFSVLPIISYLKEHYAQRITGQMLESVFHHNFDYMNRRFKESTGLTIFSFLERYRIEKGKQLLESKRFTIAETADALGFCNSFYFSRVFKKHEHITPSEYKKLH